MKSKLNIITLAMAFTISLVSNARESMRNFADQKTRLTPVQWIGNFRCEEKIHEQSHSKEHECDLKFVSDETGQEWNVKNTSALQSLHQKSEGTVKAHVQGDSSPRYLLGGSYIEIQKIELIPTATEKTKSSTESEGKTAHLCSL